MPITFFSARYCLNGHLLDEHVELAISPLHDAPFCSRCGEKTLTECSECHTKITGSDDYTSKKYPQPSYCSGCATAFPWTERLTQKLIKELTKEDSQLLIEELPNLTNDTPATEAAVVRIKEMIQRLKPSARDLTKATLSGLVTEGAKRLFGF